LFSATGTWVKFCIIVDLAWNPLYMCSQLEVAKKCLLATLCLPTLTTQKPLNIFMKFDIGEYY
jgi:hypothetical protein